MKKNMIFLFTLLSFYSIADESDDLAKYQFEYDSIMSKSYLSPRDQMQANVLIEKIRDIKKHNPKIDENSSILDSLSNTKDYTVVTLDNDDFNAKNKFGLFDNLDNFNKLDNIVNSVNTNPLTRDQEDSCGAILCLSSSTKPSECISYLKRYFSIKIFKKGVLNWGKTVNARRDFLGLCPMENEKSKDNNLNSLVTDILPNQRGNCTAEELNSITDRKNNYIRTSNKLPEYCVMLAKHSYTDFTLPNYNCNNKYYTIDEWKLGYYLVETNAKKYREWINDGNKGHITKELKYYKHINVEKKCWFDNKK